MAKMIHAVGLIIVMGAGPSFCRAQAMPPVSWRFDAQRVNGNEMKVLLTAALAPGWHIYSQHVREGGPIATRFRFDGGDDVILESATLEKGQAHTVHDSAYDMDVTWYAGSVVFEQRIRLVRPVSTLTGTVEYLTCNDEICIPARREFSIRLTP